MSYWIVKGGEIGDIRELFFYLYMTISLVVKVSYLDRFQRLIYIKWNNPKYNLIAFPSHISFQKI